MINRADRLTTVTAIALVLGALLACKKKQQEETPAASATVAPEPPKGEPKVETKADEIKRYADKETVAEGTVRANFANVKVFREADDHGTEIAVLPKGTLVNRKATMDKFVLVEYLSPTGQLSLGWVEAKFLPAQADKTAKASDVAKKTNTAAPASSASAAAAPSASAPAPSATAAAAPPASSASQAAAPPATATASARKPPRLTVPR